MIEKTAPSATLADIGDCLTFLNTSLSQTPIVDPDTIHAYWTLLQDMAPDLLMAASVSLASRWPIERNQSARILPTAADLRREATNLLAEARRVPVATEAWTQVQELVAQYGSRGVPLPLEAGAGFVPPTFSHAIVERTVTACGGYRTICLTGGDDLGTLRAQFLRIYNGLLNSHINTAARLPAITQALERLRLEEGDTLHLLPQQVKVSEV